MSQRENISSSVDLLKNKDSIGVQDRRWDIYSPQENSLDVFHERIDSIKLHRSVPQEILINFETAKNTLLYSYFSYRLSTPALSFAMATLEMSFTKRFEAEKVKMPNGLRNKMLRALDLDWLDVTSINTPQNIPEDWKGYVRDAVIPLIADLRNNLAHSPQYLTLPYQACEYMSLISRLINMLSAKSGRT